MAVSSGQVAVGTTATLICTSVGGATLVLRHAGGAVTIFYGDDAVTTSDGLGVEQDQVIYFQLPQNTSIYGVVTTSTEPAHWLLIE
jgi:murein DD-endopeptidase MepM/ murein hydrolase activator NlpD